MFMPRILVFLMFLSFLAPAQELSSPPQNAEEGLARARELLGEGRVADAVRLLESLEHSFPQTPGLERELGIAYFRSGEVVRAVPHLEKAVEQAPEDREAIQLLGLSYHFTGKPQQAIPLLEEVHSWFPSANVDANYYLGVSYIQVRDFDKARGAFGEMYGVGADSAASYLFTARMLLRQGFDTTAEEYAKKAAELDPKLPGAHFLLGEFYLFKSRIEDAIAEFEQEKAVNPSDAAVYYKLADAYSRVQKWDEAQKLLQQSIWLDSTASGPFVLLGKVLLRKGEARLAARALEKSAQMDPNNYVAHHLLGQAYRALGEEEAAARELKTAQQLQSAQNPKPE